MYSIRVTRNLYLSRRVRNFIVDIMSYRMHVLSTVCMYLFLKYGPEISVFVVTFSYQDISKSIINATGDAN